MTFRELASKNFRANIKKYLSIFLSCGLCIVAVQVFLMILFNRGFSYLMEIHTISMLLKFSIVVLAVFSVFFISYTIRNFMRGRSRELGIYMMLGMSRKQMSQMIVQEIVGVAVSALLCGIIGATLFALVLFELFRHGFGLSGIHLAFELESYALTIAFFVVVFGLQFLSVLIHAKRLQPVEILKSERKPQNFTAKLLTSGIACFFALIAFGISFTYLYEYIVGPPRTTGEQPNPLIFVALALLGLYLIIAHGGNFILSLCKHFKQFFHKHMMSVTETYSRYKQNTKIIFSISVLCIAIVFLISSAYTIALDTERAIENEQPYSVVYVDYPQAAANKDELTALLNKGDTELQEHLTLDFLHTQWIFGDVGEECTVISDAQYRALTGEDVALAPNEAMTLSLELTDRVNEPMRWNIQMCFGDVEYNYTKLFELRNILINIGVLPTRQMLIVRENEFAAMWNAVSPTLRGTFHLLQYEDWTQVATVMSALREYNGGSSFPYTTYSKLEYHQMRTQDSSMRMFITCFVGVLFLLCIGSVLYLKLLSEVPELRQNYRKLSQIGMTNKEYGRVLSWSLGYVYFVPFVIGSALGYAIIIMTTQNTRIAQPFTWSAMLVITAFFIFQLTYYLLTRYKYIKSIIRGV